jgi:hypothetical protein
VHAQPSQRRAWCVARGTRTRGTPCARAATAGCGQRPQLSTTLPYMRTITAHLVRLGRQLWLSEGARGSVTSADLKGGAGARAVQQAWRWSE